ncbi:MAG: thiol:disulfide interchange protein DsbC [Arenicella sp.]|jgi:thiol:disulfide interchange protein DsbC
MNINTKLITVLAAFFAVLGSAVSLADEKTDIEKVRVELEKMIPQAASAEIVASPVKGVYRLQLQGNYAFAYVAGDYVLMGDLYNTKSQVNFGDQASSERMASLLKDVPTSKMIVYGPENPKRYMTVFTDIDCGYCRKLHNEVPELNAAGIEVRYLAFPRAGIGSASHKKYVSVWCNDDQQTALTTAKAGGNVAAASCDNPIEETYKLGKQVGVKGTPTIIFDDGTVAPGYLPSATLIERLGLNG